MNGTTNKAANKAANDITNEVTIGSEITVTDPSPELTAWCRENLVLENPEYISRRRRGLWLGKTPRTISLYREDGNRLILPTGTGKDVKPFIKDRRIALNLADNGLLDIRADIPLYEYQKAAVEAMRAVSCGILQAPCGSGKTQMGIALAAGLRRRTLWVTHTQDLLEQSYSRAAQYLPREVLGKITAGKVQAGSFMTFATVQTLYKLDLAKYRYEWDAVIVDECHRAAGSPTGVTMFYKVLSSLAARYKYGLSATVSRSDGLIRSTFAIIGPVVYRVPEEAAAGKTVRVRILRRDTGILPDRAYLDTDGTLDYSRLLAYLSGNAGRSVLIARDLAVNREHYNLVLSDRLEHLRTLMGLLPDALKGSAVMIDGGMAGKAARAEREAALESMRAGKKHYLFATYALAKEGLDIPRLDRLYLTTPKRDPATVQQCIGRIARAAEGKTDAVAYDYVDQIAFCENRYGMRRAVYRKAGCEL